MEKDLQFIFLQIKFIKGRMEDLNYYRKYENR